MMYSNEDGNDEILVTDYSCSEGFPIFGHSRLYIQDENGTWYMTEYAGETKKELIVRFYKEEPVLEQ